MPRRDRSALKSATSQGRLAIRYNVKAPRRIKRINKDTSLALFSSSLSLRSLSQQGRISESMVELPCSYRAQLRERPGRRKRQGRPNQRMYYQTTGRCGSFSCRVVPGENILRHIACRIGKQDLRYFASDTQAIHGEWVVYDIRGENMVNGPWIFLR